MSEEIEKLVRKVRKQTIPDPEAVVKQAFRELGYIKASPSYPQGKTPTDVQGNFNLYLKNVFKKTLEVLERYEFEAYAIKTIEEICKLRSNDIRQTVKTILKTYEDSYQGFEASVKALFQKWYPDLWKMFLSISQSRKARGGVDFQYQLSGLFDLMDLSYDKQREKFRVDFYMPSITDFQRDRTRCMLISLKRTLRERWREVVGELYETRAPNVYLATADEDISFEKIKGISRHNIRTVVWDEIKEENFPDEPMVISYTQLANREIPAFRQFWAKRK